VTDEVLPIKVIAGSPTDEETAAIAALFSGLLLERAVSSHALPEATPRSAWDRRKRAIRAPFPAERRWQDR
jgi:hypothetical protein